MPVRPRHCNGHLHERSLPLTPVGKASDSARSQETTPTRATRKPSGEGMWRCWRAALGFARSSLPGMSVLLFFTPRPETHMRRSRLCLSLLLTFCPALVLLAQATDSTRLPRIVVTATRIASPIAADVATTHVLDGTALRHAGVRDVAEALRFVPGAFLVRSGGAGAQSSLFLRGGESDYVRVLVDGVPMNEPGGAIDLAAYTLDDVDRIEVVRGPASVLYGTDAVTGVIQIFTRRGLPGGQVELSGGGGTWNTRHGALSLGAGGTSWSAAAGLARRRSDGTLPFNNDYRNDVVNGRLTWHGVPGSRFSAAARQFDDELHYPTDGAGNVVDRNAWRADRRTSLAFDAEQALSGWGRLTVTLASLDGRGRTDDARDGPADSSGLHTYRSLGSVRRRVAGARIDVLSVRHSVLTVGSEWSRESQRSRDSSNFAASANTFGATRRTSAAYAQWVAEAGRLQIVAGGRYDDNDVFGVFRTARGGMSARLWRGGLLRGSVGTAFKAPAFLEQFNTAFTVGNAGLSPERSRAMEVGLRQALASGRAELGITWFDQRFRDLIQYTFLAPDRPNYFNVAAASSRGVEAEGRARVSFLQGSVSAALLRTHVDDAGFDSGAGGGFVLGQRLLRRPSHTITAGVVARPNSRLLMDVTALRVGARDDLDFSGFPATPVRLQPYTRVDASVQVQLAGVGRDSEGLVLLVRADNLGAARYEEIHGFAAPGRSLFVGLRATGRR